MSPPARYLAAALLAVAAAGGTTSTAPWESDGDAAVPAEVVTTFADPEIDESSGIVVRGRWIHTVNDSGDGARVFTVDRRTGRTVGVSVYDDEDPDDVEALAPGGGGTLWVGDIGDNREARGTVRVHRLVPAVTGGEVAAATFELTYPDRPHDAEALLVHPRTGRLLLVTKGFARGGGVYRAPRRLVPGRTHQLERLAAVPGMVTDGTFLADGSRVLLRGYGTASVYTYPRFERVLTFTLPVQEQGEGVAVDDRDRVYLSSEGERQEVLAIDLPPDPPAGASTPTPAERPERDTRPGPGSSYDPEPWLGVGPAPVVLGALATMVGVLGLRAALRRGRRRR